MDGSGDAGTQDDSPIPGVHVLASNLELPYAVASDGDTVFWTTFGLIASDQQGTITSIPRIGGTPTILASNLYRPHDLTIDGGRIYWANEGDDGGDTFTPTGSVERIDVDGSDAMTIASEQYYPTGVRVSGGDLYWLESAGYTGTIQRSSIDGGAVTTVLGELDAPEAIVVDGETLYFSTRAYDKGPPIAGGSVQRVSAAGGTPELLARPRYPRSLTLLADEIYLLQAKENFDYSQVAVMDKSGGVPEVLVDDQFGGCAMARSGSTLYWTNEGTYPDYDGQVMKMEIGSSQPTVIASKQKGPCGLAVDDRYVYWVNRGTSDPDTFARNPDGEIVRAPK